MFKPTRRRTRLPRTDIRDSLRRGAHWLPLEVLELRQLLAATADLQLSFDSATVLPAAAISDGTSKIPLVLDITNLGPLTAFGPGVVSVVAHRDSDGQDVALGNFKVTVGVLGTNKLRMVTVAPTLPFGMSTADYTFVATLATIGPGDAPGNNTASSADIPLSPLTVTQGVIDLAASFGSSSLPINAVQGVLHNGQVNVTINNAGNVTIPAGLLVNVSVALRPASAVDASQDIGIGSRRNVSMGGLVAGNVRAVPVSVTVPIAQAEGDYIYVVQFTPVAPLIDSDAENNVATGGSLALHPAYIDLALQNAATDFPPSAIGGTAGTGTLQLKNLGNITANGQISVRFYASESGVLDDNSLLIGNKTLLLRLVAGQTSATINVPLSLPTGVDSRTFTIFVRVTTGAFVDSNLENNLAEVGTVTRTPGFVDLHFAEATNPFADHELSGAVGNAKFIIENQGNLSTMSQLTITYYATGFINTTPIVIGRTTFKVALNGSTSTAEIPLNLKLPSPSVNTAYQISARMTSTSPADQDPGNDVTDVLGIVIVSHFTAVFPPQLGDILTFAAISDQTVAGTTRETGTFTTNKNASGTYSMALTKIGTVYAVSLALQFNGLPNTYSTQPHFTDTPFLFGGHVIHFAFDPTGSIGFMGLNGKTAYFS